ncbi:hypothetical protein TNCT_563881 [Trichonephila clavata]|uniref:U1-type domain-containing protein n=1 Tax=Trichonephila clavata TaxID=2740835 RepID=A0A8X6JDH2_TRICU|nr:hypothetical protein TNCT_563881 [Trichonephila clavata]
MGSCCEVCHIASQMHYEKANFDKRIILDADCSDQGEKRKHQRSRSRSKSRSPKHKSDKKSEINHDIPDRSFGDLFCRACDCHMNGEHMWEAHIQGKRHMKVVRRVEKWFYPSLLSYFRFPTFVKTLKLIGEFFPCFQNLNLWGKLPDHLQKLGFEPEAPDLKGHSWNDPSFS